MWARIMTERFGAKDEKSTLLRFHTQTGGSTLTAQQPDNNVVRVTLQALAAVMGGTQSLHTNGFDEALGLPTARAARLSLRTQQIIAAESGVVDTVDPLGGSYFVESLTDAVEAGAQEYLDKIDGMGGSVAAIEAGFHAGRDRGGRLRLRQGGGRRARRSSSASTSTSPRIPRSTRCSRSIRTSRPTSGPGSPGCGPSGTRPAVDAGAGRRGRGRPGHPEPAGPDEGGPAPAGHPR